MLVRVDIEGVYYDAESKTPVVMLKETNGEGRVPILIGPFEAMAILIATDNAEAERPITHDLAAELVKTLGGKVLRVEVTRIVDGVFMSLLHVEDKAGAVHKVDARPSDSVAIAARFKAPIYVSLAVIEAVKSRVEGKDKDPEYWKKYLEELDNSAFGKYRM